MRHQAGLLKRTCVLIALALSCGGVAAQDKVIIYRCTDANGAVTLQNDVRCPKGSQQERRVVDAAPPAASSRSAPAPSVAPVEPSPAPALPAPPATPTFPASEATAATAAAGPTDTVPAETGSARLPPPVLYECRTYDDDRYLSENGTPQQRCVTLTTTGLGGVAAGAGEACEMKTDACQRVPDGALCERWRQRLREAESALRFGASADRAFAETEVQRVARIVRESVCSE